MVPLDVSPDGEARLLVRMRYYDAGGKRVHLPSGGHVNVSAGGASVQWQPRVRFGDPAAIVRLREAGPVSIVVDSDIAGLPRQMKRSTDTRAWRLAPVSARALGPYAVTIGWFPRLTAGAIRIERSGGRARSAIDVYAPASSFTDSAALPGAHYTYLVRRPHLHPIVIAVDMPPALPRSSIDTIRGTAMWLSFDAATAWNVDAMLARARSAGIAAVELRMSYGEYNEVTPAQQPAIDRFIDGAARNGIAVIGWTVPRAVTYEDLAAGVAVAAYRTTAGHHVSGLAVDLERGSDFFAGPAASADLARYLARLRAAVGPRVLLIATVEDPYLERLPSAAIPYAAIAARADVLQPMCYWRMRRAGTSIDGMRVELGRSFEELRRRAGRNVPIDIGGQTADLGNRYGAPPPAEVAASVVAARAAGAIGETFFDWDATTSAQWTALANNRWRDAARRPVPRADNERH